MVTSLDPWDMVREPFDLPRAKCVLLSTFHKCNATMSLSTHYLEELSVCLNQWDCTLNRLQEELWWKFNWRDWREKRASVSRIKAKGQSWFTFKEQQENWLFLTKWLLYALTRHPSFKPHRGFPVGETWTVFCCIRGKRRKQNIQIKICQVHQQKCTGEMLRFRDFCQ